MPWPRRVRAGIIADDDAVRDARHRFPGEQRLGVRDQLGRGEFDLVLLVDDLEGRDRIAVRRRRDEKSEHDDSAESDRQGDDGDDDFRWGLHALSLPDDDDRRHHHVGDDACRVDQPRSDHQPRGTDT